MGRGIAIRGLAITVMTASVAVGLYLLVHYKNSQLGPPLTSVSMITYSLMAALLCCAVIWLPSPILLLLQVVSAVSGLGLLAWAARGVAGGSCRGDGLCPTQIFYGVLVEVAGFTGSLIVIMRSGPQGESR